MTTTRPVAIGLVTVSGGRRSAIRWWNRAVVVRHARDQRLQLVDVLELSDDGHENAQELLRLAALAAHSDAQVLVTYGVRPDLARNLATDLGLTHSPAPDRPGASTPTAAGASATGPGLAGRRRPVG